MATAKLQGLVFKHLIELPNSGCVFCSTQERLSGRTLLFLIFNSQKRVYRRSGLSGTWNELVDDEDRTFVKRQFDDVVRERRIPCYRLDRFDF